MKANTKAKIEEQELEKEKPNYIYDQETGELIKDRPKINTETKWKGQPNVKYKKTKYDWLFIPLSWFIVIIAIFWMVALKENTLLFLLATLLLLFGLYCLFIRNHKKKKKRAKYSYEITETDLTIIYTHKKQVKVRQLPIENIKYIAYSERKNKVGTLYFNFPNNYKDLFILIFANSGLFKFDERIFCFFEIEDAFDVANDIKAASSKDILIEKI